MSLKYDRFQPMTTNIDGTEVKILSIEDLYTDLKKTLKQIKDGDTDVLIILDHDLLHPNVNEKDGVANALKSLNDLAATRAQVETKEASDENSSTAKT